MNFRTRPHFEDRQLVQYGGESIKLSGTTIIAPTVLDFSGSTTAETAVTISDLTGYLSGRRLSGLKILPPELRVSGSTGSTTVNVENYVLKAIDPYGSVAWSPLSGVSWSVSACTSPLNVTNIVSCTPGGTVYFTAGDIEFGTANVGINVSPPTNELHVVGSIRMEDGNEQNGYVLTSDALGVGSWQTPIGTSSGNCLTDLWVTNIHGCSPITIWDNIQSLGSSATGTTSFAFGINNSAYGTASFAEGGNTKATGDASHAEGSATIASGDASHAEGYGTIALGDYSHSEGYETSATADYTHTEGYQTSATTNYSHSEGFQTVASGLYSHSEGFQTVASQRAAHSEGRGTVASGLYSHAGGFNSTANGNTSFIHSSNSVVTGIRSVVLGGQNITGTTNDTVYVPYLNISNLGVGSPINNLGIDSSGNVVVGTTGSGSTVGMTLDPYLNIGTTGGSSFTWNLSGLSTNYEVTLSADTNLDLINVRNGEYGTIIVTQDAVGSRSIVLGMVNGSSTTHKVVNGGGGSVALTTNPNAVDILSFTYNGSMMFWTVGNDYT